MSSVFEAGPSPSVTRAESWPSPLSVSGTISGLGAGGQVEARPSTGRAVLARAAKTAASEHWQSFTILTNISRKYTRLSDRIKQYCAVFERGYFFGGPAPLAPKIPSCTKSFWLWFRGKLREFLAGDINKFCAGAGRPYPEFGPGLLRREAVRGGV
jgi:hypothetical protein